MNIKYIKVFLFFLIGIFLFKWVYEFFGSKESLELITENKSKLFFIILIHIPTLFFDAMAWKVFIKNENFSILWSFIITWVSQASGKFFPTGTVTGEFIRIYLGTKKGLSFHESSSTVFADLVIATFSLFLIASLSFLIVLSNNVIFFQNDNSFYIVISLLILLSGCVFFYFFIKRRLLKFFLNLKNPLNFKLKRNNIKLLLKIDYSLFKISSNKLNIFKATITRLLGWISGALEIYVFLMIINVEVSFVDVILIEAFTGLIRSVVFFIPAGLGVQELAFVIIGSHVGLSDSVSFSMAIGRRIREIGVGLPAILTWFFVFEGLGKKGPVN
jgi:uncharacterized protein (TIRG00374 family)|tara:strand:+ start:465 stop:1454 length:990 start_codon:yes stop_codon:yes gene_type:complete